MKPGIALSVILIVVILSLAKDVRWQFYESKRFTPSPLATVDIHQEIGKRKNSSNTTWKGYNSKILTFNIKHIIYSNLANNRRQAYWSVAPFSKHEQKHHLIRPFTAIELVRLFLVQLTESDVVLVAKWGYRFFKIRVSI